MEHLPADLLRLIEATCLDGKEMKWNFSTSADRTEVKLTWIPVAVKKEQKLATVAAQPGPKKKYQSPSTRKHNAQRYDQWRATRKPAVVKKSAETQTSEIVKKVKNTETQVRPDTLNRTCFTDNCKKRDQSTEIPSFTRGTPLTPTKYRPENEHRFKPWEQTSTCRSPYLPSKACYKTYFEDGHVEFSAAFDIDNCQYTVTELPSPYEGPIPLTPEDLTTANYDHKERRKKSTRNLQL